MLFFKILYIQFIHLSTYESAQKWLKTKNMKSFRWFVNFSVFHARLKIHELVECRSANLSKWTYKPKCECTGETEEEKERDSPKASSYINKFAFRWRSYDDAYKVSELLTHTHNFVHVCVWHPRPRPLRRGREKAFRARAYELGNNKNLKLEYVRIVEKKRVSNAWLFDGAAYSRHLLRSRDNKTVWRYFASASVRWHWA